MYKKVVSNNYQQINELVSAYKKGEKEAIFDLYEFYRPLLNASVQRCLIKDKKLNLLFKIFYVFFYCLSSNLVGNIRKFFLDLKIYLVNQSFDIV